VKILKIISVSTQGRSSSGGKGGSASDGEVLYRKVLSKFFYEKIKTYSKNYV